MESRRYYKTLSLEKKDHIAVISLPGFAGLKTIEGALSQELDDACSAIAFDREVRVLVIAVSEEITASAIEQDAFPSSNVVTDTIAALGFPTIAAIAGDAVGFGLELAMACDIRIAAATSRFGLPQICDGGMPAHGGTQRLPRLVGRAKAMEMILTGCLIDAEEAYRTSLIARIVPEKENVAAAALDMARDLAEKAPVAVRYAKEAIHKGLDLTLDQGLRMENDLYILLFSTADRVEGIEAFKAKRKPVFRGE